jgi:type IV pilus assembly protein PilF
VYPAGRTAVLCLTIVLSLLPGACGNVAQNRRNQADAHFQMANSYLQQGRGIRDESNRRKAYPELNTAIRLDPRNASFHLVLGTIFLYNRELIRAEREMKKALAIDPDLGDARNNLGLIYIDQGRLYEAIDEFKKAIGNYSYQKAEIAYFNLGRASFLVGDYTAAVDSLKRSLDIIPNNEEALFLLGRCHAKLGGLAEAEKTFVRALALRPDSARTHYELGLVLFKRGRKDVAATHFEEVVRLDPHGEMADKSETFIKLLR